jgi:hypothetical protein
VEPDEPGLPELSEQERDALRERVEAVPADTRAEFEAAYEAWKQTWSQFPAALDSTGNLITHNEEFVRLVNLPDETLPLLMEKLADPEEHFAVKVAEQKLPPEHVPTLGPEHPEASEGEQYRARLLLSNWVAGL